jgi:hypothetical protein
MERVTITEIRDSQKVEKRSEADKVAEEDLNSMLMTSPSNLKARASAS